VFSRVAVFAIIIIIRFRTYDDSSVARDLSRTGTLARLQCCNVNVIIIIIIFVQLLRARAVLNSPVIGDSVDGVSATTPDISKS